jgi:hypothetical protein
MGDEGTLIAEQSGPNPTDDGVVIASRKGSPLAPLPTPAQFAVTTDARDHRLMSFRALVREFTRGIGEGDVTEPELRRRLALPAGAGRGAGVVGDGRAIAIG